MPPIKIVIPRGAERPPIGNQMIPRFIMNCQVCFERIKVARRQCTDEGQPVEIPPILTFVRDRYPMRATCPECGADYEAVMEEKRK